MSEADMRFAVVGLGMGVHHCRDLRDAEGCELVAICDKEADRLEKNGADFPGVITTPSFDDLLANPDIDVINVCTPSGLHGEHTVAALQAGKHVICEKPPDVTVAAVDRMIAARDESGKQLMVIFQSRFEPLYRRLKETIDSGRLGKLVGVHGTVNWWRAQSYFNCPGMWKGTWRYDGGGSMANQGVHTVDLLQWLGGPVVEVYGKFGVFTHEIESEDKTASVWTFANGAIGSLTTTTSAYPGMDRTIFIHGEKGSVQILDDRLIRWRIQAESREAEMEEERKLLAAFGPTEQRDESVASDPFAFATRGHLAQFENFAKAIRAGETVANSIETTRHTVEIMEAVYESGRTGQPVRLG